MVENFSSHDDKIQNNIIDNATNIISNLDERNTNHNYGWQWVFKLLIVRDTAEIFPTLDTVTWVVQVNLVMW